MKENSHERALCDAVMKCHSQRTSSAIKMHSRPEEKDRNKPAVEYLYLSSSGLIAVEHTRIESFPGQIQDGTRLMQLLAPLQQELKGQLPTPGKYRIIVNINTVNNTRGDYDRIRSAIANWAKDKAPLLKLDTHKNIIQEQPLGVPFICTLHRLQASPRYDGYVSIVRSVPENIEMLRRKRIATALNKKLPKLGRAKKENGSNIKTVLIFESNDIGLGNCSNIGSAFQSELQFCSWRNPDFVYLVETDEEPWYLTILKEGDSIFPNISDGGPFSLE